ncbi:MAG: 2-octaprenyl-6-methoxyphenyl hydroxylase [Gammaproteobacteria bacterium]|nr:MAG: 2-octaprenyl-6-methoxyphenyl hydroxylase [Gammaproteobacteria bacterium]
MTKKTYDLIIIGGGMAGASLACALADTGIRMAVIEAVPWQSDVQPSYDVRTISLSHGSRLIYETMGIWQQIDKNAVCPIHRIHVSDRGHPGVAHLDRKDAAVEALGYVIENRALGAALMARLETLEHIDIICPAAVSDVDVGENFATLICTMDNEEITVKGKLVVIADGGRSGLREKLGFLSTTDDYRQTAIVCNVTPGKSHQHCAYERFTPSGPLAMLPMNEDRCWCVWAVAEEEVDELIVMPEDQFLERLQKHFGDRLGRFLRAGRRYAYPLARNRVESHTGKRVVLVGNAAHTVHPVAAQGFNLGLRDVAWLAEVLVLAHDKQQDPGALNTLQQYENIRDRDTQRVTGFTHGMIKVFTSRLAPVIAGRNLALLATDIFPELKQALLKRTMGLTGRQARLARGLEFRKVTLNNNNA